MTSNHNYFECLCALAASDELTAPELAELREHSLECASCRNRILEMTQINACLLLSHAFNHRNGRMPEGMRERFIARAIKEGVPLTSPSAVGLGNLGVASALFIILLVTAAAIRTGPFSRPVLDAGRFDAAQYIDICSRDKPHATGLYDESPSKEERSEPRQVKERPGSVAPRSIASVTSPSGNFPKPLFSRHIVLAAFHVGGNAVGRRPAVVLAVHAVEVQVGSSPNVGRRQCAAAPGRLRTRHSQPDDHSIGVHFCNSCCSRLSSRSRYGSVQNSLELCPPLKFHFVEDVTQ